jgi:hypothetical protein
MNHLHGTAADLAADGNHQPPRERRLWIRHTLKDPRAIVSWDEGPQRVRCAATVINISGGGAAALAERAPAPGHVVQLRLGAQPNVIGPLEATAIASTHDPSGKSLIRMRFTSWAPLDGLIAESEERRYWQRYPVRENRAVLSWTGETGKHVAPCELLNISGGGVAVAIEDEPPAHQPIWFGLVSSATKLDVVESILVVISHDPSGLKIARLKFVDPCAMRLFELAVEGSARSGE